MLFPISFRVCARNQNVYGFWSSNAGAVIAGWSVRDDEEVVAGQGSSRGSVEIQKMLINHPFASPEQYADRHLRTVT